MDNFSAFSLAALQKHMEVAYRAGMDYAAAYGKQDSITVPEEYSSPSEVAMIWMDGYGDGLGITSQKYN